MPELGTSGSLRSWEGQPPGLLDRVFFRVPSKRRSRRPVVVNPRYCGRISTVSTENFKLPLLSVAPI
jgi:hypothetical protein